MASTPSPSPNPNPPIQLKERISKLNESDQLILPFLTTTTTKNSSVEEEEQVNDKYHPDNKVDEVSPPSSTSPSTTKTKNHESFSSSIATDEERRVEFDPETNMLILRSAEREAARRKREEEIRSEVIDRAYAEFQKENPNAGKILKSFDSLRRWNEVVAYRYRCKAEWLIEEERKWQEKEAIMQKKELKRLAMAEQKGWGRKALFWIKN